MNCQNCFKNNMDAFEKATCIFSSRRPLVIFILNVLNIKDFRTAFVSVKKIFRVYPASFEWFI